MSGIEEVVLSVFDIERACAPMIALGGFRRIDLPDLPVAQLEAWGVPGGARARQVLLLPPNADRGALRVVKFEGVEQQRIRPSQRTWDTGGIFDVDIFSADVRTLYRNLERDYGWTAFGEPVDYIMGEFDTTQVVAQGPDGLVLALIQPHKPPLFEIEPFEAMSRIFNSTQLVADLDTTLAFYSDVLGWKPLVSMSIDDAVEPGADVLGLPMPFAQTAKRRVAIVHPEGRNDGSIELIEIAGWQGKDYRDRAVAPNVGLLALRLSVASAAAYADEVRGRGGVLLGAPRRVEIAPHGEITAFAIRAPEGAILEFIDAAS